MARAEVEESRAWLKGESPCHVQGGRAAGQARICNKVVHTRGGFEDAGQGRLLYRARYYDRIAGT